MNLKFILIFGALLFNVNLYSQTAIYGLNQALKSPEEVTTLHISCPHHFRSQFKCDTIEESIDKLVNLKHFSATESSFKSLPRTFTKLQKLESFTISENNRFDLNELCKLTKLPNLASLSIYFIQAQYLPSCISDINTLEFVDIGGNYNLDLSHSISILEKLPKLIYLKLHINKNQGVPSNLLNLSNLKYIDLSYSETKKVKKIIRKINPKISGINLSDCGFLKLPKSIKSINKIKGIDLSDNWFNAIPNELKSFQNLKYLSLRSNGYGVFKLNEVPSNLYSLEYLDLSDTKLDSLPKNITKLESLKFLNITNCDFKVFPHHLSELKSLRQLNMSFKMYNENDVEKLKKSLPNCTFSSEAIGRLENAFLLETMNKWE